MILNWYHWIQMENGDNDDDWDDRMREDEEEPVVMMLEMLWLAMYIW